MQVYTYFSKEEILPFKKLNKVIIRSLLANETFLIRLSFPVPVGNLEEEDLYEIAAQKNKRLFALLCYGFDITAPQPDTTYRYLLIRNMGEGFVGELTNLE